MKKIIFLAAVIAMGLSSCSKNEVSDVLASSDNVDRIGISAGVGTTKGGDMVGSSLHENNIILSYIDSDLDGVKKGALTFVYKDGKWSDNTDNVMWSNLTLPATFYSFCDETGNVNVSTDYTALSASLATDYAVSDVSPEYHKDLLYAANLVGAVPAGGKVYTTFKHALSKIDLISVTGYNSVVANYVAFSNLSKSGNVDLTANNTGSTLKWKNFGGSISYESVNRERVLTEDPDPKILQNNAIICNIGSMTESTTGNMKVIPQTIKADYKALQAVIKAHQADNEYATADYSDYKYIEVMYRMNGASSERIVGFEDASKYPDFKKFEADIQTKYTGKPLFIRAAFVLSNELALKASSYYKLKLNFNTFGGLLMDDYYYDQNGDRTPFKVLANVETGDPIIPSAETVIGITVVVDEWTPESDTDMQ